MGVIWFRNTVQTNRQTNTESWNIQRQHRVGRPKSTTSKVLRYDLVLLYNTGLKTNDILICRCYIVDTLDFSLQLKEWLRIVSETHSEASQARKRFQCSFFLNRIFDQPIWELYSFNHGQISSEFNFTVDIALLGHIAALVMGLLQLRYEHDSSTIRLRFGYNTLQHATRFFVRSHTRSIRGLHENQW